MYKFVKIYICCTRMSKTHFIMSSVKLLQMTVKKCRYVTDVLTDGVRFTSDQRHQIHLFGNSSGHGVTLSLSCDQTCTGMCTVM